MSKLTVPVAPYMDRTNEVVTTIFMLNVTRSAKEMAVRPLPSVLEFGRYGKFIENNEDKFAALINERSYHPAHLDIDLGTGEIKSVRLLVVEMPSGQFAAILTLAASSDLQQLVNLMELLYYGRIRGQERSLEDEILEMGGFSKIHGLPILSRFYCQLCIVSKKFREGDRSHLVQQLVRRHVTDEIVDTTEVFPKELNLRSDAFCATSPFVTIVSNQQEYIESSIILSMLFQTAIRQKLSQLSAECFGMLKRLNSSDEFDFLARTSGDKLIQYSKRLERMHIEVSLSAEQPMHIGSVIPSLRAEDFHRAILNVSDIPERLRNLDSMISRIERTLAANSELYRTVNEEKSSIRRGVWASVVGATSFIAIPASLVLAFLGSNVAEVDGKPSIFDLSRFFYLYAGAAFTFVILILCGSVFWFMSHGFFIRRHKKIVDEMVNRFVEDEAD